MKKHLLLYTFYLMIFTLAVMIIITNQRFIQRLPIFMKTADADNNTYSFLDFEPEVDDPSSNKNIFFIETSGITKDEFGLNSRQGCAIESAAKMNPNTNVYLLLVSRSMVVNQTRKFFDQLKSYPNVRIRRVCLDEYMRNTPLEKWYKKGTWTKSQWVTSHMSDVLRYLTLWKYGGIYLDLDIVVTKSLEDLKNFAGLEDYETVNSAAIGFDSSSLGRFMSNLCIHDLEMNFRGDIWGHNGPGVITRVLQKFCSTEDFSQFENLSTEQCHGFQIFPTSVFYPVTYRKWIMYFKNEYKEMTMELVKKARAIHLWNKLSYDEKVHVESDVPYAILARKHCPKIFHNSGTVF